MISDHLLPDFGKRKRHGRADSRLRALTPISILTLATAGVLWTLGGSGIGCGAPSKPNIVLVIMDTVRADAVGRSGDPARVAPNYAALCDESTVFLSASAAGPWTIPSHGSIFTGLYPHEHRAIHENYILDDRLTTLAEILSDAGYVTGAITANPWVNGSNGWAQGFDYFEEAYRLAEEPDKGGDLVTGFTERWLAEVGDGDRPFFLFINYLDAHLPYAPPDRVLDQLGGGHLVGDERRFTLTEHGRFITGEDTLTAKDLDRVRLLYAAGVAYVDEQVGRIVGFLEERGILDGTLLILTSDHGEHLGEHHLMGHEFSVYEEVLRVPLLVRHPALFPAGERVSTPVSLLDIVPTMVEVLGHPPERSTDPGISLLHTIRSGGDPDRVLLAEYARPTSLVHHVWQPAHPSADLSRFDVSLDAIRAGSYKYIRSSRGTEEAYHLQEDSGERANLVGAVGTDEVLTTLRATMRQARWGYGGADP